MGPFVSWRARGVSVKIYKNKDANGNYADELDPDEAVSSSQELCSVITVDFTSGEKPTVDSPDIKYVLPSNISVLDKTASILYDADGVTKAGKWRIEDGVAYLEFDESWLETHKAGVSTHFDFSFKLDKKPTGDGDKQVVNFPGQSSSVTINTKDGNVTGDKWANDYGAFNAEDNTYSWTVRVSSDAFATNLVPHDKLGASLEYVTDSFELVDANGNHVDGTLDVTYPEDGKADISLGSLPKGDYYVRYKTKLRDGVLDGLKDGEELSGVDNSVSWSWGADGSHHNDWDVTKDPQKVKYSMVSKSASGTNVDILWTVTLNNGSLKADMDGYEFSDTLGAGQKFKAGTQYEVRDASGNLLASGNVGPARDTLDFKLPQGIGKQQVTVTYHCEMDDPSSPDAVDNSTTVTPSDGHGPSGTGTGTYQPSDERTYVTKELADASTVEQDGYATWRSEVKFSAMSSSTDPAQVVLTDKIDRSPYTSSDANRISFDQVRLVTSGGIGLVEGTDYVFGNGNNPSWNYLVIQFKDSDTVRALLGQGDVIVTYRTKCSGENGTYSNTANLKISGADKGSAKAHYDIEKEIVPPVTKRSDAPRWDASYDWGDGTKGAWLVGWTVRVNCAPNAEMGASDLAGADITVSDELDGGLTYVQGTAHYNAHGNAGYSGATWQEAAATLDGQNVSFTIPTGSLVNDRGSWRGYVDLWYQTATRSDVAEPGASVTLGNTAEASAGDKRLELGKATTTISNKVLDKQGERAADGSHVKYTIKVNERALKLSDEGTLTLIDKLGSGEQFANGSLTVTEGGRELTEGISCSFENVTEEDGSTSTVLTLKVPDEKSLVVTYEVAPQGVKDKDVLITNEATLQGYRYSGSSADEEWKVIESHAGAHGTSYGVTITKRDSSGGTVLKGARFSLYQVDLDASIAQGKVVAKLDDGCGDNPAYSSDSGVVTFGTSEHPLESSVLYYFVEDSAPAGYEVTNTDPTYVMFCGTGEQAEKDYREAFAKANSLGIKPSAGASFSVFDKKSDADVTEPSGEATLRVAKLVNAAAPADDAQFDFALTGELDAPMPKDEDGALATTLGDDIADFGSIAFGKADEGKTYTYTITETGELGAGWTKADTVTATVAVGTPSEDDPATIPVSVTYSSHTEDGKAALFNNVYEARGEATLTVAKRVNGNAPEEDQSFQFGLSAETEGAPMPKTDEGTVATTTGADAARFGDIEFSLADAGAIYEYRIHELTEAGAGRTNAPDVIATVTVGTDQGDGTLGPCTVTYHADADEAESYTGDARSDNAYEAAPATASPTVAKTVKTLDGCDYHVTDGQFSFTLSAVSAPDGVELAADQVASCADGGTASFGELTFSSAGTYVFQVSENEVDPALAPNVSDDDTTYTLTYVVEEGADRNLHVTSTAVVPSALDDEHAAGESDEGIAFVNHETPATPDTPATPSTPTTPDTPDTPSAVTPTAPHDEHHMPQTGDTLGGVRLAVVLVAAAGVAFVVLGLAGARRRMRR
uniref:Spy0128 family protein n=1 Tax=Parolsenella massiliensis TaxID=1871022 RepID=UPI00093367D6|nr:FctA domain-containing protein [Parolsenella massiliensis]